jgi:hypothetical protein
MPNRRSVLLGSGTATIGLLSGCAGVLDRVSKQGSGEPSVEEVKQNSESIPYNELYRNISEYEGEYIHYVESEVQDIAEGTGTKEYILTLPEHRVGNERILYAIWEGDPLKEGDHIEVWGIVQRLRTYESLTGEETVPEIKLVDVALIEGA